MNRKSYLALCREEPFRIFFPIGVLCAISGVSLWPLYFSGLHKFYPSVMHARLMIEGFMAAFAIGFLGTAGPRLTDTPHFSRAELGTLLALHIGAVAMHIAQQPVIGDIVFLVLLLVFALTMARRFARSDELPPPSFVLVALGFVNAIAGTACLIVGAIGAGNLQLYGIGAALLHQGFLLHLVLGVGSFLLPRILNIAPPSLAELAGPRGRWRRHAAFGATIGVAMTATLVCENFGVPVRAASLVRFALACVYLGVELPFHRTITPGGTMMRCAQAGLVLLVLGLFFPTLWPLHGMAGLHVIFIGGFTLITFTVATRVILGHSGGSALFRGSMPVLLATAATFCAALTLRTVADFLPAARPQLLSYGAWLWIVAAMLWAARILPRVRIPDPES